MTDGGVNPLVSFHLGTTPESADKKKGRQDLENHRRRRHSGPPRESIGDGQIIAAARFRPVDLSLERDGIAAATTSNHFY